MSAISRDEFYANFDTVNFKIILCREKIAIEFFLIMFLLYQSRFKYSLELSSEDTVEFDCLSRLSMGYWKYAFSVP